MTLSAFARLPLSRLIAPLLCGALLLGCTSASGSVGADDSAIRAPSTTTARSVVSIVPELTPATSVPVTAPTTTEPARICSVTVQPGDSLSSIASGAGLAVADLVAENLLDVEVTIHPGQVFDVCIGNDVDDVTGTSRLAPPPDDVRRQQEELNELFARYSLPPLALDGDSGKYTRQAICAARMGLGLPVHAGHLPAGSDEEAAIFAATELSIPAGAPTDAERWILIDQTCQVIFTGEGDKRVVDVFPTSTGEPGHETYNVRARAFRFDPAADNNGWHDSTSYPVAVDNPLNGNMYKPLYFNDGQAIHGAGYVPPQPRSKGCARTFPTHQDRILQWLGLDQRTEATWSIRELNVTVVVQGRYVDPTAT